MPRRLPKLSEMLGRKGTSEEEMDRKALEEEPEDLGPGVEPIPILGLSDGATDPRVSERTFRNPEIMKILKSLSEDERPKKATERLRVKQAEAAAARAALARKPKP